MRLNCQSSTWPTLAVGLLLSAIAVHPAPSTIPVEGLLERQVYTDAVEFRIPGQPGYEYACWLDNKPLQTNVLHRISAVDYHELRIQTTRLTDLRIEERTLPFIIRSSERNNSEWGLPPWTPFPVINSSPAEFSGRRLRVIGPAAMPRDYPIPLIAWIEETNREPVRLNGLVEVSGNRTTTLQLRRGIGSRLLAAETPGRVELETRLHSLTNRHPVVIEDQTSWQTVGGTLTGTVAWASGARILVTNDLEVSANTELSVGPGAVVLLEPLVNLKISGRFLGHGNTENPILFMPRHTHQPWGGFLALTNSSIIEITGAILTGGGGDPAFFPHHFGFSHRPEQPLFVGQNGARVSLTNCYLIDNPGQAGNGYMATFELEGCLVQRCIMTGQFEGGSVSIRRSALIEFPEDSPLFQDDDFDALYLVQGTHELRDSLLGWAKDDGLDAGSGSAGTVLVTNCWIESCYHEGLAWSGGGRVGSVYDTVLMNCGQGIEAGWSQTYDSPIVNGDRLLCVGNIVGARFGDNYDWNYAGFLRLTQSLLLYNQRDAWGMTWGDWTYRSAQMDLRSNYLSQPNPWHPDNAIWDPSKDGPQLARFRSGRPDDPVGIGLALHKTQDAIQQLIQGIPVGLSCFSSRPVQVNYSLISARGILQTGTLAFAPGQTLNWIPPLSPAPTIDPMVLVSLEKPQGGDLTGIAAAAFVEKSPPVFLELFWAQTASTLWLVWNRSDAILECSETSQGSWTPMPDVHSPLGIPTGGSSRFYRLRL